MNEPRVDADPDAMDAESEPTQQNRLVPLRALDDEKEQSVHKETAINAFTVALKSIPQSPVGPTEGSSGSFPPVGFGQTSRIFGLSIFSGFEGTSKPLKTSLSVTFGPDSYGRFQQDVSLRGLKFLPTVLKDCQNAFCIIQHISAMPQYWDASPEELRWEYYQYNGDASTNHNHQQENPAAAQRPLDLTLPEDILGVIVPFLQYSHPKALNRLSMTCRRNLEFIQSNRRSLSVAPRSPSAPVFSPLPPLQRLNRVESITLDLSSPSIFGSYRDIVCRASSTLRSLTLINNAGLSQDNVAAVQFCFDILPCCPNLHHLSLNVSAFRFLPQMGQDPNSTSLSPSQERIAAIIDAIVTYCPRLKSITLPYFDITMHQLSKLKALKMLKTMNVYSLDDPISDDLFKSQHSSKEELLAHVDKFVSMVTSVSPVGIGLQMRRNSLLRFASQAQPFPIPIEILKCYQSASVDFSSMVMSSLSHHDIVSMEMLELLIYHKLDVGVACGNGIVLLLHLIEFAPSVQLFKLIFETKLIDGNTTAFEYARYMHPEYPFFWDRPLFSSLVCLGPTALELLKYIQSNYRQLLPIFGAERVLGGPSIPCIHDKLPLQYMVDNSMSTCSLQFLLEQGANPWSFPRLNLEQTVELWNRSTCKKEEFDLIMNVPSFNPSFVDPAGFSMIDIVLRLPSPDPALLSSLLDAKAIVTDNTPEILIYNLHPIHDRVGMDIVGRIVCLFAPQQMKRVVNSWLHLLWFQSSHSNFTKWNTFVVDNLAGKFDVSSLELELMQKSGFASLWDYIQADDVSAVNSLVSRAIESPFCEQIVSFWRSQLAVRMSTAQKPISPKFLALLSVLDCTHPSQAQSEDMINSLHVAVRLATKLSPSHPTLPHRSEAELPSLDVSFETN